MKPSSVTLTVAAPILAALSMAATAPVASAQSADAPATASAQLHAEDHAAIHAVIQAFQEALKAKDKAALQNLFYNQEVIWRASLHPGSRQVVERMTGQAEPVVRNEGAFHLLDDPAWAGVAVEERFYNPRIVTDGQIATVTFQYDFRENGAISNWGDESWQMVRTPDGWKILTLLFSAHIQAINPAPDQR